MPEPTQATGGRVPTRPFPAKKTAQTRPQPGAGDEPLAVDASKVIPSSAVANPTPEPEIVEKAAPVPEETKKELPDIVDNVDGTTTVNLRHPLDMTRLNLGVIEKVNFPKVILWKQRREAARNVPAGASDLDLDTALLAMVVRLPEAVIDDMSAIDVTNMQAVLGKLLYSPQMLSRV